MTTLFTKIINREISADIVYEDEYTLAFLDINPVKKGHTLVVPKKEIINVFDGDAETLERMMCTAQKVAKALVASLGAKGVNIHMNNGEEAGQEVPHAHLHVIPRYAKGEVFLPPPHEKYEENESANIAKIITTALAQ